MEYGKNLRAKLQKKLTLYNKKLRYKLIWVFIALRIYTFGSYITLLGGGFWTLSWSQKNRWGVVIQFIMYQLHLDNLSCTLCDKYFSFFCLNTYKKEGLILEQIPPFFVTIYQGARLSTEYVARKWAVKFKIINSLQYLKLTSRIIWRFWGQYLVGMVLWNINEYLPFLFVIWKLQKKKIVAYVHYFFFEIHNFEIHEFTNLRTSFWTKTFFNEDLKHIRPLLIHELMSHEQILFKFFTFFFKQSKKPKKIPPRLSSGLKFNKLCYLLDNLSIAIMCKNYQNNNDYWRGRVLPSRGMISAMS